MDSNIFLKKFKQLKQIIILFGLVINYHLPSDQSSLNYHKMETFIILPMVLETM